MLLTTITKSIENYFGLCYIIIIIYFTKEGNLFNFDLRGKVYERQ